MEAERTSRPEQRMEEGAGRGWAIPAHWSGGLLRFLLGTVLAAGRFLGSAAPFGVGFVACSGSGSRGLCAAAGACLGYLSLGSPDQGLRYAAACVLVFSTAFAFYDVKIYRKAWFMPLAAAVMDTATGFVYLSEARWDPGKVALFVSEVVLAGGSCVLYRAALSPRRGGGEGEFTPRQKAGGLFLAGSLLMSLSGFTVLGEVSLGRAAGGVVVLALARAGGPAAGACAGVAVGAGMDLAAGGGGFYTMTFAFAGFLTGAGRKQGRLFGAITYAMATAVAVLWAWEEPVRLGALWEALAAGGCFLVLPEKWLRQLERLLRRKAGEDLLPRRRCEYAGHRLKAAAGAFRSVRDSLRASFPQPGSNDTDPSKVFDRAAGQVCADCVLRTTCWQKDYGSTRSALNDVTQVMAGRGRAEAEDFPGWFSARCIRFPRFLGAVNEENVALRFRRQYQNRLRESRGAVCRQYETLSQILSSAAAELSEELTPDPIRRRRLDRRLAELGLEGESAVYYDGSGRLRLEAEGEGVEALVTAEEVERLSSLMGVELRSEERGNCRVTLVQAEPLMAVAGVAARRREGQSESGDTGAWFKRWDGSLFILLCDGMGSGEWAHRESALAVRLLEEFLRTGMESAAALRTVNSALALRNEESGAFTTVDLLRLDLYTGRGEVCKLGAAPTYVRKRGVVRCLTGASLPAGLAPGEPDVTTLELEAGDMVLLVSDGVADAEDDGWLREKMASFDGAPKDLARQVMEESEKRVGAADDRTAVAVRIVPRRSAE